MTMKKRFALYSATLLLALLLSPLALYPLAAKADAKKAVTSTTIINTDISWIGQPLPNPVKIVMVEIQPGKNTLVHTHYDQFCGYMISGTLQITIPDTNETAIFTAGDAFCEVMNIPHSGQAISKEPVKIVVFDFDTQKRFTPDFSATK